MWGQVSAAKAVSERLPTDASAPRPAGASVREVWLVHHNVHECLPPTHILHELQ